MKRARNSFYIPTGHTLPRAGILRGRHNFRRLFEQSPVLKSPSIHFRYRLYDDPAEGCLIGFIVKKKLGKAVTRNRIKRLLREVYRTHQHLLTGLSDTRSFGLHGVFMAQRADLTYETVKAEMIPLLEKIHDLLRDLSEPENTTPPDTKTGK